MSNYQYYDYNGSDSYNDYDPYSDNNTSFSGGSAQGSPAPKSPKHKNKDSFGRKLARFAALGLTFGLVAGAAFTGVTKAGDALFNTSDAKTESAKSTSDGKTLSTSKGALDSTAVSTATTVSDVSDIAENVMPAIVQVSVMTVTEYQNWFGQVGEYESEGAGSGIIISQDEDYIYIATNNHVVEGAKELTITFNDDKAVKAEIQGTDPNSDLAVVKVSVKDIPQDTQKSIKVATIGSSEDLEVGSSAVVIGNALGYGQSVTTGVISALEREVSFQNEDGSTMSNKLIQTDAAVNPGNSGGALLNMNGEVIGVVSAKYADTDVEGMGYAIPITQASEIISSLISGESVQSAQSNDNDAYLGIYGVDVNEQTAQQYNMPTGVYVSQVVSKSGADVAGIEKGDVITAINGKSVTSMEEIRSFIGTCKVGDKVTVTVSREGMMGYNEGDITVTLTENPDKAK